MNERYIWFVVPEVSASLREEAQDSEDESGSEAVLGAHSAVETDGSCLHIFSTHFLLVI